MEMNSKKQFFTRKRMILLAAAVVLLILILFAFDTRLMVRKYSIEAEEIETPIRIAMSEERRDGGWYYLADTAVRPV